MTTAISNPVSNGKSGGPYRVMVVDDSAIIRGFLGRYLAEDPNIEVVTTANNGKVALSQLTKHDIESVVLDIEMPEMDGLTALPQMIESHPDLMVVMASTLTRKNAEVSLKALQMGAVDYVPKPETARSVNASIDFRRELVEKVKAWSARRRKKRGEALPGDGNEKPGITVARPGNDRAAGFVTAKRSSRPAPVVARSSARGGESLKATSLAAPIAVDAGAKISLRKGSFRRPKILAIGSSTGGPQALMRFFGKFSKPPSVPVVLTQHMPATFTAILAEHIGQATGWPSQEGRDGMELKAGAVYIAPGGKHMEVYEEEGRHLLRLTDDPPENFCKPAVDPMLRSCVKVFGERVLTVILTGMGHDGLKGAREVTKVGGTVLAQDEQTSVVWGMPGAVATAGICTDVLPLLELGTATEKRLQGGV